MDFASTSNMLFLHFSFLVPLLLLPFLQCEESRVLPISSLEYGKRDSRWYTFYISIFFTFIGFDHNLMRNISTMLFFRYGSRVNRMQNESEPMWTVARAEGNKSQQKPTLFRNHGKGRASEKKCNENTVGFGVLSLFVMHTDTKFHFA